MHGHKEVGEVLTFCFKVSISDSWITTASVTVLPRHKEISAEMSGKWKSGTQQIIPSITVC